MKDAVFFAWLFLSVFATQAIVVLSFQGCARRDAGADVVQAADVARRAHLVVYPPTEGGNAGEVITRAIRALPAAGGVVELSAGVFPVRAWRDADGLYPDLRPLGGVVIDRDRVVLRGQGPPTILVLAAAQNVNVIRIVGEVSEIVIRDLVIDANLEENPGWDDRDRTVPHDRFEVCGIKAWKKHPRDPRDHRDFAPVRRVRVENVHVENARTLGVMLDGQDMVVRDSTFGLCLADVVEILTGPGEISGCSVRVKAGWVMNQGFGTDEARDVHIRGNSVIVEAGGHIGSAIRTWRGYERHVIVANLVHVHPGGSCDLGIDQRSHNDVVESNLVIGTRSGE